MPTVTILVPCFNEAQNVRPLYERISAAVGGVKDVKFEVLFIDNASADGTVSELRQLAGTVGSEACSDRDSDGRCKTPALQVRIILNQRNFGHVRSPFHGLLEAGGDAVIVIPADLQVPPESIPAVVEKWRGGSRPAVGSAEAGTPVVLWQRSNSEESFLFSGVRRGYYRLVKRLAEVELLENVPGWGLFDRKAIEAFRGLEDPYPYTRGLIAELGFPVALVPYEQPARVRGITKNNFYTLYDVAMLGITSHSKVPLRLATMLGFASACLSFLVGLGYLVYKVMYWNRFSAGTAPVVIGLFFFASVQLFFIGIIGEYIGSIHTKVTKRPLVVERERIPPDWKRGS